MRLSLLHAREWKVHSNQISLITLRFKNTQSLRGRQSSLPSREFTNESFWKERENPLNTTTSSTPLFTTIPIHRGEKKGFKLCNSKQDREQLTKLKRLAFISHYHRVPKSSYRTFVCHHFHNAINEYQIYCHTALKSYYVHQLYFITWI